MLNTGERSEQEIKQLHRQRNHLRSHPRRQKLRNERKSEHIIDDTMINIALVQSKGLPVMRSGNGITRPTRSATRRKRLLLLLLKHFWQLDREMMLRDLKMCVDRMLANSAYRYVCRLGIVDQSNN